MVSSLMIYSIAAGPSKGLQTTHHLICIANSTQEKPTASQEGLVSRELADGLPGLFKPVDGMEFGINALSPNLRSFASLHAPAPTTVLVSSGIHQL